MDRYTQSATHLTVERLSGIPLGRTARVAGVGSVWIPGGYYPTSNAAWSQLSCSPDSAIWPIPAGSITMQAS